VPGHSHSASFGQEGRGSRVVRDLGLGEAPEWASAPTRRPSHDLSLEASLGQARVVPLDEYKIRLTRTDVVVVADLPGALGSEVSLSVDPGRVTISSEIRARPDDGRGDALWQLCRDMRAGRYDQTLPIPDGLLVDRWSATFEDGVLRLRIPRALS
jgi:HSP20 family molecular chaperone IbpA